jgi:hypothetical protein
VGPRAGLDDVETKNSSPYRDSNSDLSAVQSVVSHYTDCAIPVTTIQIIMRLYLMISYPISVYSANSENMADINITKFSGNTQTKEYFSSKKFSA